MKNFVPLIALIALFISCKPEVKTKVMEKPDPKTSMVTFGFIKVVNSNAKSLAIDFCEKVKKTEFKNLGQVKVIELPDQYCFVNREEKDDIFDIADNVNIIMQKFSFKEDGNFNFNQNVTLVEFLNNIKTDSPKPFLFSPFEFEITNNKITRIKEIYIP